MPDHEDGPPEEHRAGETEHDMRAEAFVPLDAEITEYGLEATQQLDMDIRRWVCSCGQSWTDKEEAERHLQSATTDN